jgi:hypothetical protein
VKESSRKHFEELYATEEEEDREKTKEIMEHID